MYVLMAYDIAHPRRLKRVADTAKRHGVRIQKSVFECELTPEQFEAFCDEVSKIVNKRWDRVRFYRFCVECRARNCVCGAEVPFVFVF